MAIEAKATLLKRIEAELADKVTVRDLSEILEVISNQLTEFNVEQKVGQEYSSDDMLEAFLSAKAIEGRSPKTLRRCEYLVRRLMEDAKVPTREITVYHVRKFLRDMKERGLKDSTLESVRQVFSSYFNWLQREGLINSNPSSNLGAIKCEKKLVETFTDVEIEVMKGVCDIREKALIMFLTSTGCRVSELTNLNRDSIDLNQRMCVVHGKGNKDRLVYFDSVTCMVLRAYLESRQDEELALFLNNRGERIHTGGVRFVIKGIAKRAGVEHAYPHKFRRTCATKLIARGMSVQNVARILGHDKLETTMKYVKIDDRAVHSAFNVCA